MGHELRAINPDGFEPIFHRIRRDFAQGEYAPFEVLRAQLEKGVQKGILFMQDEKPAAYSICAEGDNGYVLISLFAVYPEYRGIGVGSVFLEEIKKLYRSKGILVEVEKPENAATAEDKAIQERRIRFYEKAGFRLVPDVDYSIWDIEMHLMVLQESPAKNTEIGKIIYDIYYKLMGKRYIHKMKFKAL